MGLRLKMTRHGLLPANGKQLRHRYPSPFGAQ